MTYTIPTPSTVSAGDTFPASAYNIISNNLQDHEARIVTAAMTGMVSAFAGVAAPSGWLLCDGSPISRTTYSALFAVTSTTYGVGDGSTTFNVPDLKGRTVIGVGVGTEITGVAGVLQGAKEVTLSAAQSGTTAHGHAGSTVGTTVNTSVSDPGHVHAIGSRASAGQSADYDAALTGNSQGLNGAVVATATTGIGVTASLASGALTIAASTAAAAASAHTNIQPSIPLTYIIKY